MDTKVWLATPNNPFKRQHQLSDQLGPPHTVQHSLIKIFSHCVLFCLISTLRLCVYDRSDLVRSSAIQPRSSSYLSNSQAPVQPRAPNGNQWERERRKMATHARSIGRPDQLSLYWSFFLLFRFRSTHSITEFLAFRAQHIRCLAAIFSSVLASIWCIYSMLFAAVVIFDVVVVVAVIFFLFSPLRSNYNNHSQTI